MFDEINKVSGDACVVLKLKNCCMYNLKYEEKQ